MSQKDHQLSLTEKHREQIGILDSVFKPAVQKMKLLGSFSKAQAPVLYPGNIHTEGKVVFFFKKAH